MQLGLDTKINALVGAYPFLLDYLSAYSPQFEKLRSPVARATVGRIATVRMAAALGGLVPEKLLADVRAEIERQTGHAPEDAAHPAGADAARREELKAVVVNLHTGADVAGTRNRFARLLEDVGPTEIARMENELIGDGLPAEEVRRLCDLHVEVFKPSLDQKQPTPNVAPGHPVHTFLAENRALEKVAEFLRAAIDALGEPPSAERFAVARPQLANLLGQVAKVELHYQRKENQLFPFLEKRGVCGPPQVMWAIHDQIRAHLKAAQAALEAGDAARFVTRAREALQGLVDMVYKEDNILFPMSLELLDDAAWAEIRRGEAELGYALVTPAADWPASEAPKAEGAIPAGLLPLDTGLLALEQINLMLNHLPVEVSFVDENDEVRYYSRGPERIFPRSPGVIGRKVQNCHPPKSLDTVNRILSDFRAGTRDKAEFWIQMRGRFLLIRYFAIRDAERRYRGTLEVTEDVTEIRKLEGERRLLDA